MYVERRASLDLLNKGLEREKSCFSSQEIQSSIERVQIGIQTPKTFFAYSINFDQNIKITLKNIDILKASS